MRRAPRPWVALAALALLLLPLLAEGQPAATEGSEVHLSLVDGHYVVSFAAPPGSALSVGWRAADGRLGLSPAREKPRPPTETVTMYVADLPPDATGYQVGTREFAVTPPPGPGDHVRVGFIADQGTWQPSHENQALLEEANLSLLLVGGDISYANGTTRIWDAWFDAAEPLASRIPVMPAFGNHEIYCANDQPESLHCPREVDSYRMRFETPNEPSLYYAFDWGPMRVAALDVEAYYNYTEAVSGIPDATQPDEQAAFLNATFADASGWRTAFFHRSPYVSHNWNTDEKPIRESVVPLLDANRVDLALSGHAHQYVRTWPMRGGNVTGKTSDTRAGNGTVYVVSGGGGATLHIIHTPLAPWVAKTESTYEFVVLDVCPNAIDETAYLRNGTVLDHFRVSRDGTDCQGMPVPLASVSAAPPPEEDDEYGPARHEPPPAPTAPPGAKTPAKNATQNATNATKRLPGAKGNATRPANATQRGNATVRTSLARRVLARLAAVPVPVVLLVAGGLAAGGVAYAVARRRRLRE